MTDVTYYRVAGPTDEEAPAGVLKTCPICRHETFFLMTQNQYDRWKIDLEYVQDVFPHLNKDIREWMISGTHPECWDKIFAQDTTVNL